MVFCYLEFKVQKIPVLTYHGVVDTVLDDNSVDISKDYFEKQMKYLYDNGYKTITMDEFYEWKNGKKRLPRKSILITFDDGWKNNYINALPILEKYNFSSCIFVLWGNVNDELYLSLDDLDDIIKNHKSMKLYSHSYALHSKEVADSNNYNLYNSDIEMVKDIADSIEYYAYPYGHMNDNYRRALKDNGYKLAFTFGPYAFASKDDDDYKIPRYGVFESTPFWKLKLKLALNM